MRVIATKQGYHGKLREVGDEFDVPDGEKASWFEPKEKPAAEAKAAAKGKQADGGTPAANAQKGNGKQVEGDGKAAQPADAGNGDGQAAT